jgi:hypothetical protein
LVLALSVAASDRLCLLALAPGLRHRAANFTAAQKRGFSRDKVVPACFHPSAPTSQLSNLSAAASAVTWSGGLHVCREDGGPRSFLEARPAAAAGVPIFKAR